MYARALRTSLVPQHWSKTNANTIETSPYLPLAVASVRHALKVEIGPYFPTKHEENKVLRPNMQYVSTRVQFDEDEQRNKGTGENVSKQPKVNLNRRTHDEIRATPQPQFLQSTDVRPILIMTED